MPSVSSRFVVGQRLELRSDSTWVPSRLEDIAGDQLTVAWPTDRERRLVPLKPGDTLELTGSAQDALYSATVRIVRTSRDGVPTLHLHVAGPWQRSQRREAVRLPVAIRPRQAFLQKDDAEKPLHVGITNMSASGVQLRSQEELKHGDLLELTFSLMDVPDELCVSARVKRVIQQERIWIAGCQLENASDKTARQITQFIFAQQRAEMARLRKAS
jgi:c-di-GMP-binding flagellar brake protein YcgR